jgi:hypothetical protein
LQRMKRSAVRKRKTRQELRAERIHNNRDKQVEELFSDLERQALIDRLATLAPDREKEKHEHTR